MIENDYLRPDISGHYRSITVIIAAVLCFLGLYHFGLLVALALTWLSFSDLNVINSIAKSRSGFEIAFTAVQFSSAVSLVVGVLLDGSHRWFPRRLYRVRAHFWKSRIHRMGKVQRLTFVTGKIFLHIGCIHCSTLALVG